MGEAFGARHFQFLEGVQYCTANKPSPLPAPRLPKPAYMLAVFHQNAKKISLYTGHRENVLINLKSDMGTYLAVRGDRFENQEGVQLQYLENFVRGGGQLQYFS